MQGPPALCWKQVAGSFRTGLEQLGLAWQWSLQASSLAQTATSCHLFFKRSCQFRSYHVPLNDLFGARDHLIYHVQTVLHTLAAVYSLRGCWCTGCGCSEGWGVLNQEHIPSSQSWISCCWLSAVPSMRVYQLVMVLWWGYYSWERGRLGWRSHKGHPGALML